MNQHNIFGTDGIRTRIGKDPLTIEALPKLGMAIAQWAHEKYGHPPRILLGHDTRQSCALVKSSLQSGLLSISASIHDASIIPTPAICALVNTSCDFDLGIIISASHNAWQDNGIKIIEKKTGKLSYEDELRITRLFYEQTIKPLYTAAGDIYYITDASQNYIKILERFFSPLLLLGKKIVIDCAHGATSTLAPLIFKHFGADVIVINNSPTGININEECGALHPEKIQKTVIAHKADAGFAFDGDGDRVIAISRDGEIKNGDDILSILLDHPAYMHTRAIVGTVMTNQGFDAHLSQRHKKLLRACVGDKYVSELMEKEQCIIGGEQSGHIILNDYLFTGDGIFTALRILETLCLSNNWGMQTFSKFPQVLINIPINQKTDLASPHLANIIRIHEDLLPHGRLLVRYSGTEAVLRILVEDANSYMAQSIGKQLSEQLAKQLS
jgi:phosphoglucosamine mutase